ncbi:flagellar basal body rod protein FlgB [Pandoraea pulmonicola]|uniref:Flagellar basal body rod protein FlgB n=1 Tax=Pandoraea pulmonicola TaxID=93221 RepID=A0AAJ4ZB16_PANPU|nr:flagellar basal body rod protein FlgB [Pandoraea pulmonicola]AJC21224.1 flagellar basal-body rod protein FlgB [Pandoraea pulmonicola]SUA90090.1 Putative proximal rod protein [Pandoraea pulmonicola]
MAFDLSSALSVHPAALKLRAERTTMLASNLANQNTPGYQAMDLDVKASMAAASGKALATIAALGDEIEKGYRVPAHVGQDGNTVELGVEQAAFAQNAADFQTSLTFLNMKIKGLHAAISGNA